MNPKQEHALPSPSTLTELQERFAQAYVRNGGNAMKAARECGSKDPRNYSRFAMEIPGVVARIKELKALRTEKFEAKEQEAEQQVADEGITRQGVLRRLWALMHLPPELTNLTINGQVSAAKELAEILGMHPQESGESQGARRLPDGTQEVYRAKWLRAPVVMAELPERTDA